MTTKVPRWHGSEEAKEANSEDSGRPGKQSVNVSSRRHEKFLEPFARNAVRFTIKHGGSREEALEAGEDAHNAMERRT